MENWDVALQVTSASNMSQHSPTAAQMGSEEGKPLLCANRIVKRAVSISILDLSKSTVVVRFAKIPVIYGVKTQGNACKAHCSIYLWVNRLSRKYSMCANTENRLGVEFIKSEPFGVHSQMIIFCCVKICTFKS